MTCNDQGRGQPADQARKPLPDQRRQQLDEWVSEQLGERLSGEPASSDASFRRYFRYRCRAPEGGQLAAGAAPYSVIAMDAPPEQEDCRPFIAVADLLRDASMNVPAILAHDLQRGFLLLSDLGTTTYLQALLDAQRDPQAQAAVAALYADASAALIRMQQLPCPASLPVYDAALLRRELDLFPEWYVERHLQRRWDAALQQLWEPLCETLLQRALAQPRVMVHRDYMPRNLMVCRGDTGNNPGVLDFQDAVCGPLSYDPVCLFEDAFLSWSREFVEAGLERYWREARAAGLPVPEPAEFAVDCDLMAAQRHLKVIGIFARIRHRDGKPHYLGDVPRFIRYLQGAASRQPERLAPLAELLARLGVAM